MYITTGTAKRYAVTDTALGIVEVRYQLEEAPAALGTAVKLYADDGMCIREDAVADWEHPRIEGNTIVLSNTAPAEPMTPTLAEIKTERSTAIKAACAEAITGGFDADVLGRGPLHYTLTEIQQRDLQSLYAAIQAGATSVFWHDTSRVTHETYTAAQFTSLFNTAQRHIISCKIRSDWLEQLARDLIDAGEYDDALAITWETVLPEEYQSKCDAQITMIMQPYTT